MRYRQLFLCSFGALALASCSLINHFDSLNGVPADMGGSGGSAGDDSMGGSTAGDSTVGGKGGTGGAGGVAGSATTGGTGGVAGTGGGAPLPDGLVLVAGTVG